MRRILTLSPLSVLVMFAVLFAAVLLYGYGRRAVAAMQTENVVEWQRQCLSEALEADELRAELVRACMIGSMDKCFRLFDADLCYRGLSHALETSANRFGLPEMREEHLPDYERYRDVCLAQFDRSTSDYCWFIAAAARFESRVMALE